MEKKKQKKKEKLSEKVTNIYSGLAYVMNAPGNKKIMSFF